MHGMSSLHLKRLRSRTVVVAWAVLWLIALPLVHVHPDGAHDHGAAGHVHGGTAHTVFSPDLPHEYAAHHEASAALAAITHADEHPSSSEVGFVLAVTGDRSPGKAACPDQTVHAGEVPPPRPAGAVCFDPSFRSPRPLPVFPSAPPRAPPLPLA